MWTIIIIFSAIITPVERAIYSKISNKIYAYLATALASAAILLSLYGIAALFGIIDWK